MKIKYIASVILAVSLSFAFSACSEDSENSDQVSSHGDTESHNAGGNCMSCHKSGGEGEGWFNIAGTVYNEAKTAVYPNSTVRLYTGANGTGTLKYTINVDAKGNFYTTEAIDFGTGLYASVEGTQTSSMYSPITNGQCNSCHGGSTDKIWVK